MISDTMNYMKHFIVPAMAIILGMVPIQKIQAQVTSGNNGMDLRELPKVTAPPDSLHLDRFYKKYLNANGIAITGSWRVPDSAMIRARKIITFMTGDLPENVLVAMVRGKTRVTVMARYEGTTDVPEHAHLAHDTTLNWDVRARGLGGDLDMPLTSCAEENLLAYQLDKYHAEDILIHEFAHSIHLIGIIQIDPAFNDKLKKLLQQAIAQGKYADTYARTNIYEYWAEGVQDWFNVNGEVPFPDGKHNRLNTRKELKKYDPGLYHLIGEYFSEFKESPSKHSTKNHFRI
jgi:hypothetical protein